MEMAPLFISSGDPNGVGPEVTLKALALVAEEIRRGVLLAGPFTALEALNRMLGEPVRLARVESIRQASFEDSTPVLELEGARPFQPSYGRITSDSGMIAGRGIMYGAAACLNGEASALVTAPVSKEALHFAGFHYPGQTEMIATLSGVERFVMILASDEMRVGLVTTHMALRDVAGMIRRELVVEKLVALRDALRDWFGIAQPRIGVAALNPHASDGGIFGGEETKAIVPAVMEARELGIEAEGPISADALFPHRKSYDGLLAMYHDQGMIPVKLMSFGDAVNFTGGLPYPRTSPDHGTAFDIAGKLIADPRSMAKAIQTAYDFARLKTTAT